MRCGKRAVVSGAASVLALVVSGCDLSRVNLTPSPPSPRLQGPPMPSGASGRSRPSPAAKTQILLVVGGSPVSDRETSL